MKKSEGAKDESFKRPASRMRSTALRNAGARMMGSSSKAASQDEDMITRSPVVARQLGLRINISTTSTHTSSDSSPVPMQESPKAQKQETTVSPATQTRSIGMSSHKAPPRDATASPVSPDMPTSSIGVMKGLGVSAVSSPIARHSTPSPQVSDDFSKFAVNERKHTQNLAKQGYRQLITLPVVDNKKESGVDSKYFSEKVTFVNEHQQWGDLKGNELNGHRLFQHNDAFYECKSFLLWKKSAETSLENNLKLADGGFCFVIIAKQGSAPPDDRPHLELRLAQEGRSGHDTLAGYDHKEGVVVSGEVHFYKGKVTLVTDMSGHFFEAIRDKGISQEKQIGILESFLGPAAREKFYSYV